MSSTDDVLMGGPQLDGEASDELTLAEFLPIDAVEDDLGVEPEAIEARSAEEELHRVDPLLAPFDETVIDAVDVDAITAALASEAAAVPRARTEVGEELDAEVGEADEDARDHELAVDEVLDDTTHSHDPARDHDWAAREPDDEPSTTDATGATGATADDQLEQELVEPHHGTEFVCASCFLVRAAHQRVGTGNVCIDCAPDGDATVTTRGAHR